MKIILPITLCVILCISGSFGFGRVSPAPTPFIVSITNIYRYSGTMFLRSPANHPAAILSFDFAHADKAQIDQLVRDGVTTKRVVRIVDGERVVAEGRVAGPVHYGEHKLCYEGEPVFREGKVVRLLYSDKPDVGIVLAFDSTEGAKQANEAIKRSGAEVHVGVTAIPKQDDRRRWF